MLEEDLRPAPTESFYQGKGRKRSQFTDRSFFHQKKGEIRAQYFIENETHIRRRQILRKASYQGGAYREQLDSRGRAYPVIGIVLDWTWKGSRIPLTLHRLLALDGADHWQMVSAMSINM